MATVSTARATLDDLYRVEGKAELIGGKVVELMASGWQPNRIAKRIVRSLDDYAEARGQGEAFGDGLGYAVPELPSGRESFCPDASFHDGPPPVNRMRFIDGSPTFAVDVRSEDDYGPAAEAEMAAKRDDYFQAGTKVVWDVDPVAEEVRVYRADTPTTPTVYRPGQAAEAEPAVPGWKVDVAWVFG
jgi:Uma2 family endonuclease